MGIIEEVIQVWEDPNGDPKFRQQIEIQRRKWKEELEGSFWKFCTVLVGRRYGPLYQPLHEGVCDFLQKPQDSLLLLPRGCYKSTVGTVAYPLWLLVKYPDSRILIVNEKLSNPEKWVREQLYYLREDKVFRWLWPECCPTTQEVKTFGSHKDWTVRNKKAPWEESSVEISSLDHDVVSRGYEVIILDDLVGEVNSRTKGGLERVEQWWKNAQALIRRPNKGSNHRIAPNHIKVTGTRWDFSDIYGKLTKDLRPDQVMCRRAIEDGKLLFPPVLTADALADTRKKMGSTHFSSQFLNQPVSDEDKIFKVEHTRYYSDEQIKNKKLRVRISLDHAAGLKKQNDESVVMVVGTDIHGNLYVLEYWHGRTPQLEVVKNVYRLWEKWGAKTLLIEKVAFQMVFSQILNEYAKTVGRFLPITEVRPDGDKERRALTLQPLWEQGKVFLKGQGQMQDLEEQMTQFPKFVHDDLVDALTQVTASGNIWAKEDEAVFKPPKGSYGAAEDKILEDYDDSKAYRLKGF